MARILIAGCGDVGTALGLQLFQAGHQVFGVRRNAHLLPEAITPIAADITNLEEINDLPEDLDFLFFTAAPDSSTEEAYESTYRAGLRNLLQSLKDQSIRRVFFTSSTSVYAQSDGEWLDEDSPAEPLDFRGRVILSTEALLLEGPYPSTVLRAGGIYRPGSLRLLESVRSGKAVSIHGPPVYTNRIHLEDVAGALAHLMNLESPETLYLGVDDYPCDLREVVQWMARKIGVTPPTEDNFERRHLSSKRCSNAKLRASGYDFRYPTYREGYEAILADSRS
ncbi:MAG: SDR family oxidoreductase [Planctomycetota bacterium]|nr:SDR family oxidoreductase [Planctomycetota bacterium]